MASLEAVDLKTIELKFLRRLQEQGGRSGIANLSPNEKTPAAKRDRICKKLASLELVHYDSEVSRFTISPAGRVLLTLDTISLPVTPDELNLLKACKGSMAPDQLSSKIPMGDRQRLIRGLAERRMLKVRSVAIKEVWLTASGRDFLDQQLSIPVAVSGIKR
ncbi:MAG: hypothetical protein DCF25_08495 [Leptolyngbya foveolarum]|uniref:Uncharacterized protein n=1 Tax=Leptolyngbya foveolarum TaxID=47253 RepID=A0A2W4UJM0_9CYAN|nr:MAG: hypothetical protein DCF25_08495 [Leptolyngbya foveolarum]